MNDPFDLSPHDAPRRVLIIGSPGVGKSRFAQQFQRASKLPLYHLDDLYWQKGWTRPDDATWASCLSALCAGERWIIDGNYAPSLPIRLERANLVIWLQRPASVCVARLIKRAARLLTGQTEFVPERIGLVPRRRRVAPDYCRLLLKAARFGQLTAPAIRHALMQWRDVRVVISTDRGTDETVIAAAHRAYAPSTGPIG